MSLQDGTEPLNLFFLKKTMDKQLICGQLDVFSLSSSVWWSRALPHISIASLSSLVNHASLSVLTVTPVFRLMVSQWPEMINWLLFLMFSEHQLRTTFLSSLMQKLSAICKALTLTRDLTFQRSTLAWTLMVWTFWTACSNSTLTSEWVLMRRFNTHSSLECASHTRRLSRKFRLPSTLNPRLLTEIDSASSSLRSSLILNVRNKLQKALSQRPKLNNHRLRPLLPHSEYTKIRNDDTRKIRKCHIEIKTNYTYSMIGV